MKNQFELVTASFNKEEPVWASHSQFQWLVWASYSQFHAQEEPVWASHSQFQWQEETSLS